MFAAQQGAADTAKILLAAGADPNEIMPGTALTPLLIASAMGHGNVVSVLLNEGADPNAVDNEGFTSLHYAASNKEALSMVEELLAHGADPNIRLRQERRTEFAASGVALEGATPLLFAAEINSLEVVKALVEGGADPLIPTDQGTSALVLAAGGGTDLSRPRPREERTTAVETARFLVEHGADVNGAGQFGWAPLHAAAYQGLNDLIAYLVSEGADPDQMDRFGQTALSISNAVITEGIGAAYYQAARVFRRDTADLLLALGATPLEDSGVVQVTQRATD
jgi:ankyrin repeat protein